MNHYKLHYASNHALVRFLERGVGMDFTEFRESFEGPGNVDVAIVEHITENQPAINLNNVEKYMFEQIYRNHYRFLGNGIYPIGGACRAIVVRGVIATVVLESECRRGSLSEVV